MAYTPKGGHGGARPGAGRKPASGKKPNPNKPRQVAETKLKTVPAEPKLPGNLFAGPAIDPNAWVHMLPEIEEISRRYAVNKSREASQSPFKLPDFPKAAVPSANTMAMDSALNTNLGFATQQWITGDAGGFSGESLLFLGYAYLSDLAQRQEFRVMSETIADDATRKWVDFDVVGDEEQQKADRAKDPEGYEERIADPDQRKKRLAAAGKTDRVKELKDDQLRLEVRNRYYEQCRNGGFFGRSHLFHEIWTGGNEPDPKELETTIGNSRDSTSESKVPIGSFRGLRTIEPVWAYPQMYNAINPLQQDWYNPQTWYVMGTQIHGSRLQTFIPHPVPDMLKPAYAFGGLSLTQMAKPYVDIWLQTKQSVADLIKSFSVMVLMTDLSTLMQPNNITPLLARVAMFNMLRDNQGTFVVNKATEDFKNVSASLGGLHELQAQAQEHMSSVNRIPLVKFTGIQPSGLNASSEGEIEVYDDTIGAYQGRVLDGNLRRTINFEMLSLWGEVDPEITHRWEELRPMTQAERGTKEKDDADRDQKYVDMGALAPEEVRKRIINDKSLPYTALDPDDVPQLEVEEEQGLEPQGGRPDPKADGEPKGGEASDAASLIAADAAFVEQDHPRAENGQFGSGGGGSAGGGSTAKAKKAKVPEGISNPAMDKLLAKRGVPAAAKKLLADRAAVKGKLAKAQGAHRLMDQLYERMVNLNIEFEVPDTFSDDIESISNVDSMEALADTAKGIAKRAKSFKGSALNISQEDYKAADPADRREFDMLQQRLNALYPKIQGMAGEIAPLAASAYKDGERLEAALEKIEADDLDEDEEGHNNPLSDMIANRNLNVAALEDDDNDPDDILSMLAGEEVSEGYADLLQGRKEDFEEELAEQKRWDGLSEEEQDAEQQKQKDTEAEKDKRKTAEVNSIVDKAIASGWFPSVENGQIVIGRSSGAAMPEDLRGLASPISQKKIRERVAQHLMGQVTEDQASGANDLDGAAGKSRH